jgi:hypothetical protein
MALHCFATIPSFGNMPKCISAVCRRKEPLVCGSFVGVSAAQSCFVVTNATDALRQVYEIINRNKALEITDFPISMTDQICKPLVGGSSPSAGTN